jgi:amidophosphoribosyltransferase
MAGIFGLVSRKGDCSESLFYGVDYHSHLGTDYAGIAVYGEKGIDRKIHDIRGENFRPKFQADYGKMKGKYGIGVIGYDIQPVMLSTRHGVFSIVMNGNIENLQQIVTELQNQGSSFAEIQPDSSVSPAEVLAEMISRADSFELGIKSIFDRIQGSASFLILTRNGIYAVRDRGGHSALVIGESEDGYAVTTETTAFPNLGFSILAELNPGEIVKLTENGIDKRQEGNRNLSRPCAFLWIYISFPATSIQGINVERARYNSGSLLAKRDKAAGFSADLVAGVPDSGVGHGIGYANESAIPYARPIVKYTPSWPRSYMPSDQSTRTLIANMKLIAIPELIRGKRIVMCDDSIVRGTQLKRLINEKLLAHGAKEVHLRIACPPLMFPCIYNQSTRSTFELAARKAIQVLESGDLGDVSPYLDRNSPQYAKMVETIRRELWADSLVYQGLEDMASAIGLPVDQICTYCWTGKTSCAQGCA